ncbi:thioredoxin, bacteriocin transport accessory protein [Streptococcus pneumoniae]|nr:thioredoxin, bacteriocin transport accessory protein [Streptococcus pneumoniae]
MEQFLDNIKDLEVTTVVRAQEALDKKETATFFIGRKTCPYCRKFAGTLSGVVAETKAHIYFINSEEPSQLNDLQAFRSRYGIPTVPGFVLLQMDKSTSVATLQCQHKKSKISQDCKKSANKS